MTKRRKKKKARLAELAEGTQKLTPEKKNEILSCYANGFEKLVDIAQLTGINRNTLSEYIRSGAIHQEEIFRARNSAKLKAQKIIFRVLDKANIDRNVKPEVAVKAALWWLERKYPEEYAQKIEQRYKIEVVNKITYQVLAVINNVIQNPEDRRRIADGLRRIGNEPAG